MKPLLSIVFCETVIVERKRVIKLTLFLLFLFILYYYVYKGGEIMLRKSRKQSASQSIKDQFEQNQEIKIDIDEFLPKFSEVKLSGKNLAQNYASEFNTGMNIYQCLNYLQGHIGWLVKAVNDIVKKWNKNVEDMIKYCIELSKSEFDKHWAELKPQVIKLVQDTTTERFNQEWTTLKPQVIELTKQTTINQFNESWNELKPQVIELTKQTTINQFNESWEELKPELTQYVNTTINNYIDNQDSRIGKMYDDLSLLLTNLKNSGAWTQTGDTIFDGHLTDGRNIATGNINIFGGSVDGDSYIRTNSGASENDLAGGV